MLSVLLMQMSIWEFTASNAANTWLLPTPGPYPGGREPLARRIEATNCRWLMYWDSLPLTPHTYIVRYHDRTVKLQPWLQMLYTIFLCCVSHCMEYIQAKTMGNIIVLRLLWEIPWTASWITNEISKYSYPGIWNLPVDTRYPVSTSCIHVLWISNSVGSEITGLERCTQMVLKCIVDASYFLPIGRMLIYRSDVCWGVVTAGSAGVHTYFATTMSLVMLGVWVRGGYGERGGHTYRMKWYFRVARCNNHSRCFTDGGP